MTNGNYTATYTYLANSPLVSQISFKSNSVTRMTTTKSYDFLNRLSSISSAPSASSAVSFSYAYNSANQRTRATLADGSYWLYDYDSLGQVRSGKKYWSDGTPVAGQQFEYGFDDIGNRKNTKAGGDENGSNLRLANYTNNSLNQITGRGVPGYVDIMGISFATNTVTVNSQTAYRKGEYFRKELPVNNASAPLWTNIIVAATGQTSVTGNVLLAKSAEVFTYDSDGNLTSDGLWTNTWSAENRLLKTESLTSVPTAGRAREEWTYLPDGRWIQRIVSTNNGSSYYPAFTNRYVWDRLVLLAVLDHTNGLVMSFMRGLDLSGSLQGAGGVGGILAVNFKTNGTHFCAYDGNGNVAALVSATDGTESARYEYGPFAEPIRMTGPMAKLNPIRFSTQYADDVTGDVKYLFRDYDPDSGRWLSRDPSGEYGANGLYVMLHNDAVAFFDFLGLLDWVVPPSSMGGAYARLYCENKQSGGLMDMFPQNPTAPAAGNQLRGYPSNTDLTSWFNSSQAHQVAARIRVAQDNITAAIRQQCGKDQDAFELNGSDTVREFWITPNAVAWSHRLQGIPIGGREDPRDTPQSVWEAYAGLGRHNYSLGNVSVSRASCETCDECYSWSAELSVIDFPGVTSKQDGMIGWILTGWGVLTDSPPVKIATWELTGQVCCPKWP